MYPLFLHDRNEFLNDDLLIPFYCMTGEKLGTVRQAEDGPSKSNNPVPGERRTRWPPISIRKGIAGGQGGILVTHWTRARKARKEIGTSARFSKKNFIARVDQL